MKKGLQNKVNENLREIELNTDLEKNYDLNDEIINLIKEVEESDKPYILSLDDDELYLKIARLLVNRDPKRAEEFTKKALKLEKSYEGFFLRGVCLLKIGDYKGALGNFDDALRYKQNYNSYVKKAEALRKRGMDERALNAYRNALEIEIKPDVLAKYANILVDLGQIEEAKKCYDKAEELDGIDYKKEKMDKLIKEAENQSLPSEFDKIIELDENNKDAWMGKAERYDNLNQKKKAIKVLEEGSKFISDSDMSEKLEQYRSELYDDIKCDNCGGTGECPTCTGTGDCKNCGGTGDCLECEGSGYCPNCDGITECPECGGSGKSGWFSKCDVCGGDGVCVECNGHGMCENCEGTGDCTVCDGNGNCFDCQGSGECKICDGKGTIDNKSY